MNAQVVDVFPISGDGLFLSSGWLNSYGEKLVEPSYYLMALFLIIYVGILVLKRFKNVDLEKKLWNIPVIILITMFWPGFVLALKGLVDVFNSYLVRDVFNYTWVGFGFPDVSVSVFFVSTVFESLIRLLPFIAYWTIYAFYIVFLFFYVVLGPFILAKGILFDEVEAFLELVREIVILFLWQTTVIILVGVIMPEIVSGGPLPESPEQNYFLLGFVLGTMIFFAPTITRKFGNHLGSSFFPPALKWGGLMLGLTAVSRTGIATLSAAGVHPNIHTFQKWNHWFLAAEEFYHRNHMSRHNEELQSEIMELEHRLSHPEKKEEKSTLGMGTMSSAALLSQLKRAKKEYSG